MKRLLPALLSLLLAHPAFAAAEIDGWGDFRGLRTDGELLQFTTSLRALGPTPDQKPLAFTATEMVKNPKWSRDGDKQTSTGTLLFENNSSLHYKQIVQDLAPDSARVDIEATADNDLSFAGLFYFINLPRADYTAALAESPETQPLPLNVEGGAENKPLLTRTTKQLLLAAPRRQLAVTLDTPLEITVQNDRFIDTDLASQGGLRLPRDPKNDQLLSLHFPLSIGNLTKGQTVHLAFTLKATGTLDTRPVHIALDPAHPGPPFDGIGGNFRVYGTDDLAATDYNLDHLRVPWARVAMSLEAWQPSEDPAATRPRRLAARAQQDMEVTQKLADKHIPLIITAWTVPEWALLPAAAGYPGRPFVIPARRIRQDKQAAVEEAIISYLLELKSRYHAEPQLFSLNECDLGINILQTPEEHVAFIKEMGPRFLAAGLKTRFLLADACSPHPVKFVEAAMHDPDVLRYVAAVSFHSWHDGTDEEFTAWGNNAQKLNLPLLIGEGGTDADSYRYPAIFEEPSYALYELDTYVRICARARPLSILHWQMTANYSILAGGGRSGQPLTPTRRFYQIQQLGLSPAATPSIPAVADSPTLSTCAFLSPDHCILHLVNNGAAREATITNLPETFKTARLYLTDATHNMTALPAITITNRSLTLPLAAAGLTSIDATP